MLDRRNLLLSSSSLLLSPWARALSLAEPGDRRLIVVQLSGGNDGLSTVVPYADDAYQRARGNMGFKQKDVLPLDRYRGLHRSLTGLKRIFDAGHLAIIEGVGYPDQVRSHFKALEIWHTGSPRGRAAGDGWLGRLSANLQGKDAQPEFLVHVGGQDPYSLHSSSHPACAVTSPTAYRWFGDSAAVREVGATCMEIGHEAEARHRGRDAALSKLRQVLADADESSLRVRAAAARHRAAVEYPQTKLAAQAHDLAAILTEGSAARLGSTELSGFDTHAGQANTHDRLMGEVDGALTALYDDLAASAAGKKTTILVFSEFGRRVRPNGSQGTDHGKSGPMFVLGHEVKGGLYGKHPSLEDLDEGDLSFGTDFRSVYATLIDRVLGVDPRRVLDEDYPRLRFLG